MTSNTLPYGVASASSELFSNSGYAYKAFDRAPNGGDHGWYTSNQATGWLAYQFTSAIVSSGYSITSVSRSDEVSYSPKAWTYEGFDGIRWEILDRRTNEPVWAQAETRSYNAPNAKGYIKYRINITEKQSGPYAYVAIQQFKIFIGVVGRTLTNITTPTTSYTAAQQTADGITPGDPVSVNIYQISSTVGRGYAGAKTI